MDVEFHDLTYTVSPPLWKIKAPKTTILKSISGRFKRGEVSAILGPSGAGKSSLLNVLSGYRSAGIKGSLLMNGKPRNERLFRKSSCYITQDDVLQPLMTLQEVMMFATRLKMPANTTEKQRRETVSEITHVLGLTTCENTRTERLSGGQKKRLSVAMELVSNPPLVFLDEPTSGLDIVSAKHCLTLLKSIASQGRTIICTIHQPSASMFHLFDHVYIVAQGMCVYQGTPSGVISFLATTGIQCPLSYNPADFVVEVTDGEEEGNIAILSSEIENGKIIWKGSCSDHLSQEKHYQKLTDETRGELEECDTLKTMTWTALKRSGEDYDYPISTFAQFCIILSRMFLQTWRNKTGLWIQFFHHILCGVLIGAIFWRTADNSDFWFVHLKCCVAIMVFHAYTWLLVPILTYPIDVKLMKREHFNRWYNFTSYYCAISVSTLPVKVLYSMFFLSIVYFMWGLPIQLERFALFCLIGITVSIVAEGLGFAIGATFSITNGTTVGPFCLAPFLGFAVYGFDFAKHVPLAIKLLLKTSFMRCAVVAMVIVVFGMDRDLLECDHVYCHFQDPKMLLRMADIEERSVWAELLELCILLVIFRVMFFFALRWRTIK